MQWRGATIHGFLFVRDVRAVGSRTRFVAAPRDHHHRQSIVIEASDERGQEALSLQRVSNIIPALEAAGVGEIVRASAQRKERII